MSDLLPSSNLLSPSAFTSLENRLIINHAIRAANAPGGTAAFIPDDPPADLAEDYDVYIATSVAKLRAAKLEAMKSSNPHANTHPETSALAERASVRYGKHYRSRHYSKAE